MISLDVLIGMVLSEAIEGPEMPEDHPDPETWLYNNKPEQYNQPETNLPPIQFNLELLEDDKGNLYWEE